MAGDTQLTCSDCGQDFVFTAADQAFFQERGFSTPKRCKNCRKAKKGAQEGSGFRSATPAAGTSVVCSACGQRHESEFVQHQKIDFLEARPKPSQAALGPCLQERLH